MRFKTEKIENNNVREMNPSQCNRVGANLTKPEEKGRMQENVGE